MRCNLGQSKVLPDLEELRDRILRTWKVQRRAESKERIESALNKFIAQLRSL
ncbi:hypothetical protein [Chroococcidiopsis cubana]|uniref:hypothetical protein n=1 Tax=Chroococcidiopsis cubana TaxID=171392 RepID=UPI0013157BD9|nr:hypothetical protein [Chroococcidiopsis cubana]